MPESRVVVRAVCPGRTFPEPDLDSANQEQCYQFEKGEMGIFRLRPIRRRASAGENAHVPVVTWDGDMSQRPRSTLPLVLEFVGVETDGRRIFYPRSS